jgi:hypothetical protein
MLLMVAVELITLVETLGLTKQLTHHQAPLQMALWQKVAG